MSVQTDWLPSALGPGQEDDEARERFGVSTEYRDSVSYFEVRVSGPIANVVRAIGEWWESGDDESDLEFVKLAVDGLTQKEI